MDRKLEDRLSKCKTLPSPPGIVLAILKAVDDPEVTPQHLARLIEKDPALAAQLLRVVNSPYFGVRRNVTSLPQAASFLGIGGIRTMSLAFSLSQGLFGKGSSKRGVDDLLKRSVISAAIAREMAGGLALGDPEEAFLGALLQEIGILALREALGVPYETLLAKCAGAHDVLTAKEREVLGTDHAEVGAWLLGNWGLPRVFQMTVRLSHGPVEEEIQDNWVSLGKCARASGLLCDIWLSSRKPEEIAQRVEDSARLLGVDEARIQAVLQKSAELLPDVLALFEIASVMDDFEGLLEELRQSVLVSSLQDIIQVREKEAALVSLSAEVSQLRQDVIRDPLTGVFNRQFFEDSLEEGFRQATAASGALSVCFCDIDYFKKVNDTLGHLQGDRVLCEVAAFLVRELRNEDFVCRFGGDEFVLLLPNCNINTAAMICERVRSRMEQEMARLFPAESNRPTLSIGFAVLDARHKFPSSRALLNAADQALYEAKTSGRNRVVGFTGFPGASSEQDLPSGKPGSQTSSEGPAEETRTRNILTN